MWKLLSKEDYVNVAAQLDHTSDSKNLLDFILHMFRYRLLPNHQDESVDFHRRARRFMFKIISKTPAVPLSLIVTGVTKPAEQDYISHGGFGGVYKSELNGEAVALKVLYKSDNNAVGPTCRTFNATIYSGCSWPFVERRWCGDRSNTNSSCHSWESMNTKMEQHFLSLHIWRRAL